MPIHPNARRCTHRKLNAQQCGAPAVTGEPYCRFHCDVARRRKEMTVPVLLTTTDVQQAITETIRALIEGRIDRLHANSVLYGLQLAQKTFAFNRLITLEHRDGHADVDHSVVQKLLDEVQPIQEFEAQQEAEQQALLAAEKAAEEEAALAAAQTSAAREETQRKESNKKPAHHFTDDISRDDNGYLRPTHKQQGQIDRVVMGLNPKRTG